MMLPYKRFHQVSKKQKSCNLNVLKELQHLKEECGYKDDYELLRELIYKNKNDLKLLSYYVNNLVKKQQVAKVFKILQEVITQNNNFLLQRRDSGYDSDFEHSKMGFCERVVRRITNTLINAGINIGAYKYERVETPLHWATRENNINLINFFIEMGIDVDIQNKSGATALHIASINNNPNTVEVLIKKGAKVNVKDDEGNTPLFFAVSCENDEIVKSLLNAGADPNIFCPLGDDFYIKTHELQNIKCTSLHLAAFIGNFGLINLLIEYGADINAVCKNKKYSCLHMAVLGVTCYYDEGISEEKEEEYLTVVESLISQFSNHINNQDHEYNSPLHRAVSTRHEETIRILLDHGASTLVFRRGGYTAFHDAISIGSLALVELLLKSSDEREKVINAVYRPVEENGDDICFQFSPLHMAINTYIDFLKRKEDSLESFNIIKYLLSHSTLDHNIQDLQGKTPLHYAVEDIKEDQSALILINKLLTAKNINPFIKDCFNKTPFDYAKESNRSKILQALIDNKYVPDQDSLLHLAVSNGDVKAIDYLIEEKIFDINLENSCGYSLLHLASKEGNVEVIERLLHKGAAIDESEGCGYTPLQMAGINGNLGAVESLLKGGADVNAKDIRGATVIHLVIGQYIQLLQDKDGNDIERNNILNIIEHLLKCDGLDINAQVNQKAFCDYTVNKKTVLHHLILNNVPAEQQNKKIGLIQKVLCNQKIDPFVKDAENKTPIDCCTEQEKRDYPILGQYAEIQADRNTRIKNYKTRECIAYALTLCAINSAFAGIYASQYTLGGIALDLSLIFITNVAVLACCLIINKCVEKSIEEEYKNKVSDLFNGYIQAEEQLNHVIENCSDLLIPSKLDCIDKQSASQGNFVDRI
ncbi:MAG: ankyrin repeat domain-containing protein [Wolbachia endosymbiont of Xenopsylla cheopis]